MQTNESVCSSSQIQSQRQRQKPEANRAAGMFTIRNEISGHGEHMREFSRSADVLTTCMTREVSPTDAEHQRRRLVRLHRLEMDTSKRLVIFDACWYSIYKVYIYRRTYLSKCEQH
jgi:hypothetical protein